LVLSAKPCEYRFELSNKQKILVMCRSCITT
jgi:hypothetical protein